MAATLAWGGALAFPFAFVAALTPSDPREPAGTRYVLPTVTAVLLVGLLRRRPLAALTLMLAGTLMASATDDAWQLAYLQVVVNDVAVGFVAATGSRRTSLLAAGMALGVQVGAATFHAPGSDAFVQTIAFLVLAVAAAWMVGRSIAERREHAAALRAQETAQAVTAERLRIARELHDMVAHSIGVIAIQAGVGSRVIETQPDEARRALSAIESTSRETLSGLRRMLGALRRAEPVGPVGPATDPVPLDPAPGLGDLDRLVAATRSAGVEVEVRWRGARRPLPAEIEVSAFRVVQEAVTNVVRHAGTDRCQVTVDYGGEADGELAIEIVDDGPGLRIAPSAASRPAREADRGGGLGGEPGDGGATGRVTGDDAGHGSGRGSGDAGAGDGLVGRQGGMADSAAPTQTAARAGAGYGLVGMRERVGLLHGHLAAGPRPEGGFRVAVRLPVPAGVR